MLGTCPNAGSVCQEKGFVDGGWTMRERIGAGLITILKLLVKKKGLVKYTNRIELNRANLSALADIFYTPVLTIFKDFNTSILNKYQQGNFETYA